MNLNEEMNLLRILILKIKYIYKLRKFYQTNNHNKNNESMN